MVSIDVVRESNEATSCLTGLVCVFVGGTNGIGESTVRELFRHTTAPRAYIIGRNAGKGEQLCRELQTSNPGSKATFMYADAQLLKNVDHVCAEIQRMEGKINVLFLTAGFMSLKGRTETSEGIDRKMCINYYSRIRFILNLLPQLTAASSAGELSRVQSVLGAGSESKINMDDLQLKHNFTVHACMAHCIVMTDFMMEELAKRHAGTSFSHSYPGTVKSGLANELNGAVRLAVKIMYAVMTPWIINVQESGERHLFQLTSKAYPSRSGGVGVPLVGDMKVMSGSNGEQGSGAYLLDWDGSATGEVALLRQYREQGFGDKLWRHTMEVFDSVLRGADPSNDIYSKRRADSEADGSGRSIPNPAGWRPA